MVVKDTLSNLNFFAFEATFKKSIEYVVLFDEFALNLREVVKSPIDLVLFGEATDKDK